MRRRHFLRSLVLATLAPHALRAAPSTDLRIIVERGAWGGAGSADITKVAESAGGEIWRFCPRSRIEGIRIYHRPDYPQTDYERTSDGCVHIGLASQDTRWSQFAFQFVHEFCHALAQHSEVGIRGSHEPRHANLWFEECLCETASLFALRRMSETWRTRAPYRNWRSYAPALARYASDRLGLREHRLAAGENFPAWFAQNEPAMRAKADLREKNTVVASQLLPLFDAAPENWEAITFLNHGPRVKGKSFARKLADWQAASPPVHRPFIARIGAVFGVPV